MLSTCFILPSCFTEIPLFNANSVYADQTLRSVASDVGLRCFEMSLLLDAGLLFANFPFTGLQALMG